MPKAALPSAKAPQSAVLPPEFALIDQHFRPLAGEGALDLSDDAAVLTPPSGRQLVLAADAMVEGVHFLPEDPPEGIGRKLLRVNLSDLAAMGAVPLGYLLTVSLPKPRLAGWLPGFAAGLAADQQEFGISLLGGDTTSTPGPISLSLTILGHVAPGTALRRNGARAGDDAWVTGTIGDGVLGLDVLQGRVPADAAGFLAGRYRCPTPRLALGQALVGHAHAAMDVSDGLLQELEHLCRASGCAAELRARDVPLSTAVRAAVAGDETLWRRAVVGGDDYELVFAAPPEAAPAILAAGQTCGVPVTRIGKFVAGSPGLRVLGADGEELAFPERGWSHFAA